MNEIEQLLKTTLTELKAIVKADTVIGDPITVGDATVIPVVKVGFGFGIGGGGGTDSSKGGQGGGAGAGAGLEPIAFLIVDEAGARPEPIKKTPSASPSPADKIINLIKDQVISRLNKRGKNAEKDTPTES